MQAYLVLLRLDLEQLSRSWLVRLWVLLLVVPGVFLVVVAANEEELASETLAAYMAAVLAPLSWIVVSILAASAISGEAHIIADILSKSVTRSAYMWAKITARLGVFLTVYFGVSVPIAYLTARYGLQNDTSIGGIAGGLLMVASLFAFLAALGIALSTMFRNVQFAVLGVLLSVLISGVGLQFLGLNWMSTTAVIDNLPQTFRGETDGWEQVRVLVVFSALTVAAMASGMWYFRRKDL